MVEHYTYQVSWSEEDREFVATCAEFPSLSWLAPDQVDALRGLKDIVAGVVADLKKIGEPVPEPMAERKYSGRFVVRTTSTLHRRLAIEAAEKHVSLNRYVTLKLAAS